MRQRVRIGFRSWLRPKLGALRCAIAGEHRVRFVRMTASYYLEQCRWCWHTWDQAGQFVL